LLGALKLCYQQRLPELKLFAYRTIGELEASLPRYWVERGVTHRSPGLVRALAEFEFGGQTLESLSSARKSAIRRSNAWFPKAPLNTRLLRPMSCSVYKSSSAGLRAAKLALVSLPGPDQFLSNHEIMLDK
jgi:hypothetical protein